MKLRLNSDGKEVEVWAQWIEGQFWYHLFGETRVYKPEMQKAKGAQRGKLDLVAPMPGKVTQIFQKAGDSVETGKVVLVMEAMKMEYSLKSEVTAKIEKINCKVGDQVSLGQILVQMKAQQDAK
jgi:acetyl/propionyl-CoA carboxylase alpha subunit